MSESHPNKFQFCFVLVYPEIPFYSTARNSNFTWVKMSEEISSYTAAHDTVDLHLQLLLPLPLNCGSHWRETGWWGLVPHQRGSRISVLFPSGQSFFPCQLCCDMSNRQKSNWFSVPPVGSFLFQVDAATLISRQTIHLEDIIGSNWQGISSHLHIFAIRSGVLGHPFNANT